MRGNIRQGASAKVPPACGASVAPPMARGGFADAGRMLAVKANDPQGRQLLAFILGRFRKHADPSPKRVERPRTTSGEKRTDVGGTKRRRAH